MTIAPSRPRTLPADAPTADATTPNATTDDAGEKRATTLNSRLSITTTDERRHLPKKSGKPNPMAHLTNNQIEEIGRELDALRREILDSRGEADAVYIRRVLKAQRGLELGSRAVLLFSGFPPAWILGTVGLSVAKILENMELGHNIMHGQWDWMRDPKIHSTQWEWDNASPSEQWKRSHNELHHTFTNVLGRDNDLGYGLLRVDEDQRWELFHLGQPLWHLINACLFEYGIAAYDLELRGNLENWKDLTDEEKAAFKEESRACIAKIRRQMTRDYVIHPLLSGPNFIPTLLANVTANVVRNLWTNTVIICGHFPDGIDTFETDSIEGETRGEWYLRQMLGSGNIAGSKAMHLMTGNLSHQIEHHLYPDMPSNRYGEIAPRIRELMERYDLHYVTGPLPKQVYEVYKKVCVLSLPNASPERSRWSVVRGEIGKVVRGAGAARAKRGKPAAG